MAWIRDLIARGKGKVSEKGCKTGFVECHSRLSFGDNQRDFAWRPRTEYIIPLGPFRLGADPRERVSQRSRRIVFSDSGASRWVQRTQNPITRFFVGFLLLKTLVLAPKRPGAP
jgi:hypothetical protein